MKEQKKIEIFDDGSLPLISMSSQYSASKSVAFVHNGLYGAPRPFLAFW
jgi:hypothetical protein